MRNIVLMVRRALLYPANCAHASLAGPPPERGPHLHRPGLENPWDGGGGALLLSIEIFFKKKTHIDNVVAN